MRFAVCALSLLVSSTACRHDTAAVPTGTSVKPVEPSPATASAQAPTQPAPELPAIGGVFEIGIGTRKAEDVLSYWAAFGFSEVERGELDAARAKELYGVDSPLQAIRLGHGTSDHGWVRIMVWDRPTNEGLDLADMRVRGNRWGAMLSLDVLAVANAAEASRDAGSDIMTLGPFWDVVYGDAASSAPFEQPPVGVREFMLLRPASRQFVFERFGYDVPLYGTADPEAPMKTSQFTHVGLIVQDDSKVSLRFYDEVLGLLRVNDEEWETRYETTRTGDEIFGIGPSEAYYSTNFDDPRSSKSDLSKTRSGRLKVIRYPEALEVPQAHDRSRPGCLGFSLYTYRVADIEAVHRTVSRSTATRVTAIAPNEFGEPSFSFVAPDGYFWTLVGPSEPLQATHARAAVADSVGEPS